MKQQTIEAIEQLKEALEAIRDLCYGVNFSSYNQMKDCINDAFGTADTALAQYASLSTVEVRDVFVAVSVEDELPKENGLFTCELEKKGDGERTEIASFMEYRTVYGRFLEYPDGFKVKKWLKPAKAIIIEK
jgi:hypothetical protein